MMVLRKCPTWKDLAMLGDEYSMMTFLPCPEVFVPYSGWPEGVRWVSAWTWVRISLMRVGVVSWK